jgi:hypothetical protein
MPWNLLNVPISEIGQVPFPLSRRISLVRFNCVYQALESNSQSELTYTLPDMAFWTVIADYSGGTYISQVRGRERTEGVGVVGKVIS